MTLKRIIAPWLCISTLMLGCAATKQTHTEKIIAPAQPTQTFLNDTTGHDRTDPFEKDSPSVECFENEEAIKKAYERLKKARESLLAALFLPSFSFYTVEHIKTGEKKTVFTENHFLPSPFNNENEWRILREAPAKIKTIVTCALMLELQKF